MRNPKIIEVIFEGVLSQEPGLTEEIWAIPITAKPTKGAIEWFNEIIKDARFEVHIHSPRFMRSEGIAAVHAWMLSHGAGVDRNATYTLSIYKPKASVTIDSRAFRFNGRWPGAAELWSFEPSSRVDGFPSALDIVESNLKSFAGVDAEEAQNIWERDCICNSCLHAEVCALESTQKSMGLCAIIKRCAQYIPINWDGTSNDSG